MSGSTSNRPAFRLPVGLLGMLALVVVVELTITARRLDFTTMVADDWRITAEVAEGGVGGRDVLFFGDSLVKYGILPRQIQAMTGLRSYNLAINAGTMPSNYFLLRRALESGARPRAIVADFFPLMETDPSHRYMRFYEEMVTPRDAFELAWASGNSRYFTELMLGRLLPSYRCRYEIRNSILFAFRGLRASPWPKDAVIWATWKAQDGAQPMPRMPWGMAYDPVRAAELIRPDWSCDPVNAAFLDKFLALAASKGLPVFWLMPSLSPPLEKGRSATGMDRAYRRLARATQERYPNVVVLDAHDSGYDESVYIDWLHLSHQGAIALTADVASVLADRLRNRGPIDRWVALPAFGRGADGSTSTAARPPASTTR
jgi:hypothetical protein